MTDSHTQPEPMPTTGKESVTWAVIADLLERERQGVVKYGTTLQTFNGRDALVDAYQEQLDNVQYTRQLLMQIQAWLDASPQDGSCASVPACILSGRLCKVHSDILVELELSSVPSE